MADEERKPETYEEFLEYGRNKCRQLELGVYEKETIFRYKAREPWWEFIENTQKMKDFILSFRDFWGCEETYPRTIVIDPPEPKT